MSCNDAAPADAICSLLGAEPPPPFPARGLRAEMGISRFALLLGPVSLSRAASCVSRELRHCRRSAAGTSVSLCRCALEPSTKVALPSTLRRRRRRRRHQGKDNYCETTREACPCLCPLPCQLPWVIFILEGARTCLPADDAIPNRDSSDHHGKS